MQSGKIFVISHRQFKAPDIPGYQVLLVGKKDFYMSGALRDDTGINIADKNSNYCELTGLYWIWKNCSFKGYVGLVHYRRYFSYLPFFKNSLFFLHDSQINKILKKYDCILPEPFKLSVSDRDNYFKYRERKKKDLNTTREIISRLYPEYVSSFDKILNKKKLSYCNMFIMKSKELMDDYCTWLFDILFEVEKETDLTDYTASEARIYGYLSEILLNVWIDKNNIKVKFAPRMFVNQPVFEKAKRVLKGL